MPSPTARLLELLELLQSRPLTTGREICDRLGVNARTVRRYVAALEDLGIPIEGQRGVGGGYRIRPGFRLPPLMLDDDEAVAVSLGLLAARRFRLAGDESAGERALAKVHRVLPDTIRRRLEALETTLAFAAPRAVGAPIGSDKALLLADAIHRRRRLRLAYVSFAGARSERLVSPYGLVIHASRWYLVAHDHARQDLRTFRADRCSEIAIADGPLEAPPDGFDAVEVVSRSFARVPRRWEVNVLLDLSLDAAAARLPPTLAELASAGAGTRLRMRVDSLDWTAAVLAGLDCHFAVEQPPELLDAVRRVADRLRTISHALSAQKPSSIIVPVAVESTISPTVRHAALFPHDDLPDPPPDHPYEQIRRSGYVIGIFPGGTFGTVAVTAIEPEALEHAVEDVRAVLAEHGMRRGAWMIVDAVSPADLVARLETHGMTPSDEPPFEPHMSAMVLTTAPEPGPADVEARLARTLEEFVAAHRIAADAFDFSDDDRAAFEAKDRVLWDLEQRDGKYRTFVALLDGEVIAFAAAVFGANAVYLAGGGTRPDRRGRGAYRALVRARWETAVERRTPALTVGAGAMSGPILERLGFERVGRIDCLLDRFE